jgi:hypothetical protein
MSEKKSDPTPEEIAARICAAAMRAGAEAALRRKKLASGLPPERGGPKGLEPTRYGDWERKGLISDF